MLNLVSLPISFELCVQLTNSSTCLSITKTSYGREKFKPVFLQVKQQKRALNIIK